MDRNAPVACPKKQSEFNRHSVHFSSVCVKSCYKTLTMFPLMIVFDFCDIKPNFKIYSFISVTMIYEITIKRNKVTLLL